MGPKTQWLKCENKYVMRNVLFSVGSAILFGMDIGQKRRRKRHAFLDFCLMMESMFGALGDGFESMKKEFGHRM